MWDKKQSVREIKRNSSRLRGCFLIKWKDSGHGQASKHITITITITETVFRVRVKAYRTPVKIYASLQFVKFAAKLTNPLNYCLLWSKNCATLKWSKQKNKKAYTLIKLNQPKTYSEQGVQTPHDILWKQTKFKTSFGDTAALIFFSVGAPWKVLLHDEWGGCVFPVICC